MDTLKFLLDGQFPLVERLETVAEVLRWRLGRLKCLIVGCDTYNWHESGYIYGIDCRRCMASDSTNEGKSPHELVREGESLWDKVRFWEPRD